MMPPDQKTVTTILCDLGKVIVDFDHHAICRGLARHSTCTAAQIFEKIFSSGLDRQLDTGRITPERFYEQLAHELHCTLRLAQFRDIWNSIFTLNPGIEKLIQTLARRYTLVCLSNTNQWHFEYCRQQFPVLSLFQAHVLSYRVGACKPQAEMFQAALMTAGAAAHQCLYIDDILEFVQSAAALGIRGIHFMSVEKLQAELAALCML